MSLIKLVHHSLIVVMLVVDRYCSLLLNIRLPIIMLLAINVSPSSSPEWLMLASIVLASLVLICCHRESLGRLVPILAPSTLYGTLSCMIVRSWGTLWGKSRGGVVILDPNHITRDLSQLNSTPEASQKMSRICL